MGSLLVVVLSATVGLGGPPRGLDPKKLAANEPSFSGQNRPRVSGALSNMRPREAEPLDGLRRSLARPAAQADTATREPRANRAPGVLSPGEVVAMLDAYAVVQAQDALQLNDTQYGPFVGRLKKLQETRRRNQQARNQILQELRRLAGPQAAAPFDEAAIRERLKALRELDDRSALELRRTYDALDEVLDVRQQARFRMFEEQIERRKLDLLMRARQGASGRRGQ